MSINLDEVHSRGGRELIAVLQYSVLSVNTDALFLYLAREYRLRPTVPAALAMHDLFCAAEAPARISALFLIPPKDFRIEQTLAALREPATTDGIDEGAASAAEESGEMPQEPATGARILFPPNYLFDPIVSHLSGSGRTKIRQLEDRYNLERTPHENLPGGKLSQGQRAFVDFVWTPIVKPSLVRAGFWHLSTIV